ncbi:MAG: glycosyltransferase family 2 protein [Bdellovibrionota bacterium]
MNESRHKISVIMSVYNGENFLSEQLLSIANQSYPISELIIIDDCSTDGSIELIKSLSHSFPFEIKIIKNTENIGPIKSFEKGLKNASHDILSFTDQDDVWLESKIKNLVLKASEKLVQNDKAYLLFSDLIVVDKSLNLISKSFLKFINVKPFHSANQLFVQNFVTGCTCIFNRKLVDLCLPFPEEVIMHDWWLALVANYLGEIDFFDEGTHLYRQHQNNVIGAKSPLKNFFKKPQKVILNFKNTLKQTEIFLNKLPKQQNKLSPLPKPGFKRALWIIKNDCLASGKIRNFKNILLSLFF